jgi:hypothetical protein
MFQYIEGEADEDAWEPVAGNDGPLEPERSGFINASGAELINPPHKTNKKKERAKRTLIEPVKQKVRGKGGERITAKERKAAHDTRIKKKLAPPPPVEPAPLPAEADAQLAAEVEAMKADDARKSKYYNRTKTDI